MAVLSAVASRRWERQDRDEPLEEGKLLLGQQSLAADARRTGSEQQAGKSF
jgi:hypothetical protein